MKHITLIGLFTLLNISCLTVKASNSIIEMELNVMMSDTIDTTNIVIPNVFSPNGDDINDLFKPTGNFTKLNVKVYNRYGEMLYTSHQLNEGWNGRTTAGSVCPEGTYFYIIETELETFTGSLTLLR